jgi:hypothetical protein
MRKPDLVGKIYSLQGVTKLLSYTNEIYFRFIVSDEAAEWIEERSLTQHCYLKPEMLRATLNANSIGDDHFIDDYTNIDFLDISEQPLEVVKIHVDDITDKIIEEDLDV